MITQEMIDDDFKVMKDMIDHINEKMKKHLNKEEVVEYYMPLKRKIFSVWDDICCANGIPEPYRFDS